MGELFTPAVVVTGVVMLPLLSLAVDRTVGSMARFKTFEEKRVDTAVLMSRTLGRRQPKGGGPGSQEETDYDGDLVRGKNVAGNGGVCPGATHFRSGRYAPPRTTFWHTPHATAASYYLILLHYV